MFTYTGSGTTNRDDGGSTSTVTILDTLVPTLFSTSYAVTDTLYAPLTFTYTLTLRSNTALPFTSAGNRIGRPATGTRGLASTSKPPNSPNTEPGDATSIHTRLLFVRVGGGCRHSTLGAAEMTTTDNTVGVRSTLPAKSIPLTFNVMSPCNSDVTSTMPPTAAYTADRTFAGDGDDRSAVLNITTRNPDTALFAVTFSVR